MGVEIIYIVRHGHRMNFTVDPSTGIYSAARPTPTGIPADPELAKYGVDQSRELAEHLVDLEPEINVFYSSPFYRCLQTIKPTIERLVRDGKIVKSVRVENGVSEFFGSAPFAHPRPASLERLEGFFDFISVTHKPAIIPFEKGETMEELHNRNAYAMHHIISEVDAEVDRPKVILICTHAADMICIGRVLTGHMPDDPTDEDFRCGTCALSKYVRRSDPSTMNDDDDVKKWSPESPDIIPEIDWKNGKGVKGGWDCVSNGDCSFLRGGEERTWNFSMKSIAERVITPTLQNDFPRQEPISESEAVLGGPDSQLSIGIQAHVAEGEVHHGLPARDATSSELMSKGPPVTAEEIDDDQTPMQEQAPAA